MENVPSSVILKIWMQRHPKRKLQQLSKKMISTPPLLPFIKGDGEREVSKSGDRDYSNFSIEKYSRAALINQGFDVCESTFLTETPFLP